jgi:hypothetical protein
MLIPVITLSKTFEIEGIPAVELSVKYEHSSNTVSGIDKVLFISKGLTIDAGDILFNFFEKGLNELIDQTDWRLIFRDSLIEKGIESMERNPLAFAS